MTQMETVSAELTSPSFNHVLKSNGLGTLRRASLLELQVNLGKLCNQACNHCHVDAGPKRTEIMNWGTSQKILQWARTHGIKRVDITGGAPEMNPGFRTLVNCFLDLGAAVTVRCNLSILLEPGYTDLPTWYADRKIRLACSLPCYTEENVDAQRGRGVFDKSIEALRRLNEAGYGKSDELILDLVYNPGGAHLPPPQLQLQEEYKKRLFEDFGIVFSSLLAITNLPISRFAHFLDRTGQRAAYQKLLVDNFNAQNLDALMCRHLVSVDWRGRTYDCDFNQMLELPYGGSSKRYLWDLEIGDIAGGSIAVGPHCFGCTAGAGSSCGGSLE